MIHQITEKHTSSQRFLRVANSKNVISTTNLAAWVFKNSSALERSVPFSWRLLKFKRFLTVFSCKVFKIVLCKHFFLCSLTHYLSQEKVPTTKIKMKMKPDEIAIQSEGKLNFRYAELSTWDHLDLIAFQIEKKTENDCFIISCHTNAFLHQKKKPEQKWALQKSKSFTLSLSKGDHQTGTFLYRLYSIFS